MRVDFKDLAVAGASAANPALGLAAKAVAHRSPHDGNFLPNLGKSLTHHQVLSATGGNPRAVNQAVQGVRAAAVGQISHFDRRQMLSAGVGTALKLKAHHKSLISY